VELLLQLKPRHARHADIEHETARTVFAVCIQELLRGTERFDGLPHRAQQALQCVSNGSIVIDDEDRRPRVDLISPHYCELPADAVIAGSVKKNRAPPPGFAPHHSLPPCARMIERLIESPRPIPPGFVVKNGLNSSAATAGSMPGPRSATMNSTSPSASTCVLRMI